MTDINEADRPVADRAGPTVYVGQQNTGAVVNFISRQRSIADRAKQDDVVYSLGVVEDALIAALRMDLQVVKSEKSGDYGGLLAVSEADAAKDFVYKPNVIS